MNSPSAFYNYKLMKSPNYNTFTDSILRQKDSCSSNLKNFSYLNYLSKNDNPIKNFNTYLKSVKQTERTEKTISPKKESITCFEGKESKIRTKKISKTPRHLAKAKTAKMQLKVENKIDKDSIYESQESEKSFDSTTESICFSNFDYLQCYDSPSSPTSSLHFPPGILYGKKLPILPEEEEVTGETGGKGVKFNEAEKQDLEERREEMKGTKGGNIAEVEKDEKKGNKDEMRGNIQERCGRDEVGRRIQEGRRREDRGRRSGWMRLWGGKERKKSYVCKFCGASFNKPCALGGHVSKLHKGKSLFYQQRKEKRMMREMERKRNSYLKHICG